jgi:two-component system, cell cycle sensor histidine kinase and response regulator CckA
VLWVARDVTSERAAREELKRQALVFATISDGIVICDAEGRVTDWNPAAERIFGSPREAVLGRPHGEVIRSAGGATRRLPRSGARWRRRDVWHGEVEVMRPSGEQAICEVTVLPIRAGEGALVGMVSVNRDVTEKRHLQEQLWHAQKLEVTGRLAGGIAHDFNNLLTAIQGFAILLETEFAADDPNQESVREIQKAADRAAALTRHLLAFARRQVSRPRTLDLNEHLVGTLGLIRRMVGPQVELRTVLEPRLAAVQVDPTQVDQILTNLAINARDAMPEGGVLEMRTSNATITRGGSARQPVPGLRRVREARGPWTPARG